MGIRRWLSGTLRPDDVETDSITADSATVNGTTDTQALEAANTVSKVVNDQVFAGHPDFANPQDALDFADTNNYGVVLVPHGSYGPVTVPKEVSLMGLQASPRTEDVLFDGGTSAHAVELLDRSEVHNVAAKTTSGGGSDWNAIDATTTQNRIADCHISESDQHGVYINGSLGVIRGCDFTTGLIDEDDVRFGSQSSESVALGNTSLKNVTDNGSKNSIGTNS